MLDSPKNDGKPITYTLLARTPQLEADHGIPKNTEHEATAFAINAYIMQSSSTNIIRVLIADDHPVVREGLSAILRSAKDIKS